MSTSLKITFFWTRWVCILCTALLLILMWKPVLRILCMNSDGLFWAGDTAQTISSGSSFRFQDLTALLYRFEVCPIILYMFFNLFRNYSETTTSGKVRSYRPSKTQDVSSLRELPVPRRNRKLRPCCHRINLKIFPLQYRYLTARKGYDQRADAHFLPRRLSRIFTEST